MMGTPRRMTLYVKGLTLATEAVHVENKGPNVKAAYDDKGEATKAFTRVL